MKNIDMNIYRTSDAVVIKKVGDDRHAVWNRYKPSILFLNNDGIKLLDFLKENNNPYKKFSGFKRILKKMIKHDLLFAGKTDPYKRDFLESSDTLLKDLGTNLRNQYQQKKPFEILSIINHTCNLSCSYCIIDYIRDKKIKRKRKSAREKLDRLTGCIDQFFKKAYELPDKMVRLTYNGGEITLEWELVKATVEYIEKNYPEITVDYNLNTNGTLFTEEMAKFLAKHNFQTIGISIDGYKESNDITRKYANGKGTFDDIMEAVKLVQKYLPKTATTYQGTIIPQHELNLDKLMEMQAYDFKRARLGVNLIGISVEDAREMANTHFQMASLTASNDFVAMDSFFRNYKSILNMETKGKFFFHCRGFTDLAGKGLYYNVDTESVNTMCNNIAGCQASLDEIGDDLYHPLIYERAYTFLKNRYATFEKNCRDCELAGICRGGCILSGIDSYNQINEAACAFLKETWSLYVKYLSDHNWDPESTH